VHTGSSPCTSLPLRRAWIRLVGVRGDAVRVDGSYQHGLDEIFRECHDCVDNYVDDIIVFSNNMSSHKADLRQVLGKLKAAGFTSKCLLGQSSITHLGFHYFAKGITPCERSLPSGQHPKPPKSFGPFWTLLIFIGTLSQALPTWLLHSMPALVTSPLFLGHLPTNLHLKPSVSHSCHIGLF